jgi:hypothetical protein
MSGHEVPYLQMSSAGYSDNPSHRTQVGMAPALQRWVAAEVKYAANHYDGLGGLGEYRWLDGSGGVVFVAPHATNHMRDGVRKLADRWTGGLADVLHEVLAAPVLIVIGVQPEFPDFTTRADGFARCLFDAAQDRAVIDIHGMSDSWGVDVCVGVGANPSDEVEELGILVWEAFAGFNRGWNNPFSGAAPHTVLSGLQAKGHTAVQVELAARLRDPVGHPDEALQVLEAFSTIVVGLS